MALEDVVLAGVLSVSILVLFAKILAGAFTRLGIPGVLGELSAGILLGPYSLGHFLVFYGQPVVELNDIVIAFSEIGAILILFSAGLEMTFAEFRGVGVKSFVVGGLGVAIPFATGFYTMMLLGEGYLVALIVGTALSATSIAITSKVLEDLGLTGTPDAKLMINAAVVDDVLGLAVLAVVLSVIQAGVVPSAFEIASKLLVITVVWIAMLLFLVFTVPRFFRRISSFDLRGTEDAASTAICFGSASLAALLGLSPIVGAYAAGMGLAGSNAITSVRSYIDKVSLIFSPVFFAVIGASLDFAALTPESLELLGVLLAGAVLSKLVGCGVPAGIFARSRKAGERVGVGMVSRGEVGLIISGLALTTGVISQDVYAALVGVVILTTIIAPLLMKYINGGDLPAVGGR